MKMSELISAAPALRKLASQDLPLRTAYAVSRVVKQTQEHLAFYDQKHNEAVEKYYDEQEEGQWKPKSPETAAAFKTEIEELLELELDIGEIKKPIISIDCDDGLTLSANDLVALDGTFIEIQYANEEKKEENDNGNR